MGCHTKDQPPNCWWRWIRRPRLRSVADLLSFLLSSCFIPHKKKGCSFFPPPLCHPRPLHQIHQLPLLFPHLVQHLCVTLYSLLSPSSNSSALNTDTRVYSTHLSSLPQTTTPHHEMLHCSTAPHNKQSTAPPENRFLHLSPRVLVRHRNMSTDPNVFLYIPSSPIPIYP